MNLEFWVALRISGLQMSRLWMELTRLRTKMSEKNKIKQNSMTKGLRFWKWDPWNLKWNKTSAVTKMKIEMKRGMIALLLSDLFASWCSTWRFIFLF